MAVAAAFKQQRGETWVVADLPNPRREPDAKPCLTPGYPRKISRPRGVNHGEQLARQIIITDLRAGDVGGLGALGYLLARNDLQEDRQAFKRTS